MVTAIWPVHEGRCVFGSETYHQPSLLLKDALQMLPMIRHKASSQHHETSLDA